MDWYVEAPQRRVDLVVDQEKAAAAGLPVAAVAAVVRMAGSGETAGLLHDDSTREDVPIVVRLPKQSMGTLDAIESVRVIGTAPVAVGEVTRRVESMVDTSRYHKNLQPVTYVTGDVAGAAESPVYAIMAMNEALARMTLPEGYGVQVFNANLPFDTTQYAIKWDGEWHITIEVFRDLGIAFAVVLVLIYVLVVGWFDSFGTPIIIMAAIPFSLVGILPAHAAMGAFFTATSMIGFIAGAGIVVRNSIILVDFIELRLSEGMPLAQAVVDAGAVQVPAHGAHGGRGHRRRRRDPVRPHLPGPGHLADGRRGGIAAALARDGPGAFLPVASPGRGRPDARARRDTSGLLNVERPCASEESVMNVDRALHLIAGIFIVLSVLLGMHVNPKFFWFTAFVGLNLGQSAFTGWCPMMTILRKAGLRG